MDATDAAYAPRPIVFEMISNGRDSGNGSSWVSVVFFYLFILSIGLLHAFRLRARLRMYVPYRVS